MYSSHVIIVNYIYSSHVIIVNYTYSSHVIIVNYTYSSHVIIVNYRDNTVGHVPDTLAQELVPLLENSMIVCMGSGRQRRAQRLP